MPPTELSSDSPPALLKRTFTPDEVDALVREVQALHADEQDRIPYEKVREMLAELGVEPARLDEAIIRLEERKAAQASVPASRPPRWSGAGAGLAAVAGSCLVLLFGWGMLRAPQEAAVIASPPPVLAAAEPRRASAADLTALEQQSVLSSDSDSYRLVIHNPLTRKVRRVLVRIDVTALGRRSEQLYWFAPDDAVPPFESASIAARHLLSAEPRINSWKIRAAEVAE
jgi:hypothetical protein